MHRKTAEHAAEEGSEAKAAMGSRFGCRAEIPILPIFDLLPPSRSISKTSFFSKIPISSTKDGARSRRLDRTAQPMQTTLRSRRENSLRQGSYFFTYLMQAVVSCFPLSLFPSLFSPFPLPGKRNLDGGVKCPAGEVSGNSLWRYPWPICAFHPCPTTNPPKLTR